MHPVALAVVVPLALLASGLPLPAAPVSQAIAPGGLALADASGDPRTETFFLRHEPLPGGARFYLARDPGSAGSYHTQALNPPRPGTFASPARIDAAQDAARIQASDATLRLLVASDVGQIVDMEATLLLGNEAVAHAAERVRIGGSLVGGPNWAEARIEFSMEEGLRDASHVRVIVEWQQAFGSAWHVRTDEESRLVLVAN